MSILHAHIHVLLTNAIFLSTQSIMHEIILYNTSCHGGIMDNCLIHDAALGKDKWHWWLYPYYHALQEFPKVQYLSSERKTIFKGYGHPDIILKAPLRTRTTITHLCLDKMAAILADNIFKCIFFNEDDRILIKISLKLVHSSPIYNNSALVQVMVWNWAGDKPLPEPVMIWFTDTSMRH